MATLILILWLMIGTAAAVYQYFKKQADARIAQACREADEREERARVEVADAQVQSRREIAGARAEARAAATYAQTALDEALVKVEGEAARVRAHYEGEAKRIYDEMQDQLQRVLAELEPLRAYAHLPDAEAEVSATLAESLREAGLLREDANRLLEQSRLDAAQDRATAQQKAREIREQANATLQQAWQAAAELTSRAEERAQQIAGEAYIALRDQRTLEAAVEALWNVVAGYGDRYVVPTRSLLDDLAEGFGHTAAGEQLKAAREHSRRLVEWQLAATCNYEEPDRRARANRFVVDAFNGRVDAILSRTKHDNYGTLAQEIEDAYSVVNLNGLAFRDARVLPTYLDSRLAELRWAVTTQELRAREREQQRELQERIREEEKARREYERALQEAAREQAILQEAMAKARAEAARGTAEERARLEGELALLAQRLAESEARGQRALSLAQQTRAGNVYIISNLGSFGEGVVKIGMTRRLVPEDRIRELGDASVPFSFDVHAMIKSEDAPGLERMLHSEFDESRLNKVNLRKEFFRLPLEKLRQFTQERGLDVTFTLAAEAREYRETVALEKLSPEDRVLYRQRQRDRFDNIDLDSTPLPEGEED